MTPGESIRKLIDAFEKDQFVLYVQPILPMAALENAPFYQEVLIRYLEEEKNLVPPGTFFPLLQEHGLMPVLDRWVIRKITSWYRKQLDPAWQWIPPRSSINLAPESIADKGFVEFVLKHIQDNQLPHDSLSFEIPLEHVAPGSGEWERVIDKLKPAGCSFALSGFRGDKTSFDLARRLGADWAKLDTSLVADLHRAQGKQSRLKAVLALARKFNIGTVCERVESRETIEALRSLNPGPDYVQGYGIEKPRPLVER